MFLFAVGFASLLYLSLTAQPTSTVVLLPDADGKAGMVDLRTAGARRTLATPYASGQGTLRGNIVTRVEDGQAVQQRYASTLAARPAVPVSFNLVLAAGWAVDLATEFQTGLEQLRAAVDRYPAPEVTVIGHTDRVGSVTDNDQLSLQRAQTVRDKLVQAGIAASMITIAGRGEREPAVPTPDGIARAENRRVEINVR